MSGQRLKKPEVAHGYGLYVGGPRPYLSYHFSINKQGIEKEITQSYHKVVPVTISLRRRREASK